MISRTISRRKVLQGAGIMIVTLSAAGRLAAATTTADASGSRSVKLESVDSWLEITRDGSVTNHRLTVLSALEQHALLPWKYLTVEIEELSSVGHGQAGNHVAHSLDRVFG